MGNAGRLFQWSAIGVLHRISETADRIVRFTESGRAGSEFPFPAGLPEASPLVFCEPGQPDNAER
jgi:hypothetical protein